MRKDKSNRFNVTVTTLGCKVNQYESESLHAELQQLAGLELTEKKTADICIINTCTVTGKASMQSRQAIRKAVRDNPDAIIVATGCYAQSEPHELEKIKGLDYIVGNSDKHRICQIICDLKEHQKPVSPVVVHKNILNEKDLPKTIVPLIENRTRPFIKIQDGCDNFCTYCIVPFTRGPSRSLPPEEVIDIIGRLPEEKKEEIVFTGIHLGKYGLDLTPPSSLLDLVKHFHEADTVKRIRLSSLEPVEINDDLLHFTATSGRICHHFHIPLQSGDTQILKKMNRPYDAKFFEALITRIHHAVPDAAIGVDIMVGFPGETEDAFNNTFALIDSLPVTYLHVFPFSSRPGTKASTYPDHVDPHVIRQRRNKLLELGRQKKSDFYTKMIGKSLDILIEEKRDPVSGKLIGFSSNYVRVLTDGDDSLKNRIVPCRIKKIVNKNAVYGELYQN